MSDTRRRVLDAALQCFLEDGYERTTIARILERSEVSNGSLFHHFSSKEAIADALYLEAITSFQDGLWQLVHSRPRSLRSAVRGAIAHQLSWTEEHAEEAQFVYSRGHLDWESPGAEQVAALNRELADAFKAWLRPFVNAGEVRDLPMLLVTAIVSGPAHSIARRWLAGQLDRAPSTFVDQLADAATAGLRGQATAHRKQTRSAA